MTVNDTKTLKRAVHQAGSGKFFGTKPKNYLQPRIKIRGGNWAIIFRINLSLPRFALHVDGCHVLRSSHTQDKWYQSFTSHISILSNIKLSIHRDFQVR
jgi:hypothetical protein